MQYCKIQYHDQEIAQFICLAKDCNYQRKLCCQLCKKTFHSGCGIQCVNHRDLKIFFQTYQNVCFKQIFKNKIRNLLNLIEQECNNWVDLQQNNIDSLDLIRNLCQLYDQKQVYDSEDCQFISQYFQDKIQIDFTQQITLIELKSNLDQIDNVINTQYKNLMRILGDIQEYFLQIAKTNIFDPQFKLNLLQPIEQPAENKEIQIVQNNPQQLKKLDLQIYSHINLQFQLYKGLIQDSPKQKQVLIFEPYLNQNRYWGFKVAKMSNMITDNFFNIFTEQGVLGFGVLEECQKVIPTYYCTPDINAFLIFSTGKTNFAQQTPIVFRENLNIIFDYYHDTKQLKVTAFEDQISFTFNLKQNIPYYPCLVISRGDAVAFLQEYDVDLLRNT